MKSLNEVQNTDKAYPKNFLKISLNKYIYNNFITIVLIN